DHPGMLLRSQQLPAKGWNRLEPALREGADACAFWRPRPERDTGVVRGGDRAGVPQRRTRLAQLRWPESVHHNDQGQVHSGLFPERTVRIRTRAVYTDQPDLLRPRAPHI